MQDGWPRWIEQQLVRRGITDQRVLAAMARVPREDFVPAAQRRLAHSDSPLPIGCGQTISQPFIHAISLQALELRGSERVLEVGTGSGYETALLSHLVREVYSVEILAPLVHQAQPAIRRHERAPVHLRVADGRLGWPEAAPFDAIVVGAAAETVPEALLEQLAVGGRLVIPVGGESGQTLERIRKLPDGTLERRVLDQVLFVPLVSGEDLPASRSAGPPPA
ncbi:MAG TPA: protein-L-isoaspartate(D-aspartate) O-methyltransferase [bacterium]|nr:protein-L-isoaspartate(D-aspartate) O-methyltransferase [bacterium]